MSFLLSDIADKRIVNFTVFQYLIFILNLELPSKQVSYDIPVKLEVYFLEIELSFSFWYKD